ncbi:DUF4430 domain-containing protein [bacterium]|nr:DUF4430 domain-containing protein [bacterium]
MKYLKYIILIVVIVLAGYFWLINRSVTDQNGQTDGPGTVEISFMFEPGNTVRFEEAYTKQSLFALTKNITSREGWGFIFEDYGEMGLLINQINAKINGDNNKYWQYFINNDQPMLSVEKFMPQAGDKIEWKFMESEF